MISFALASLTSVAVIGLPNATLDYREIIAEIPKSAEFQIAFPGNTTAVNFNYELDKPLWNTPRLINTNKLVMFFDKIFTTSSSHFNVGNEKFDINCFFIDGEDRRPAIKMRAYLVANTDNCAGPANPDPSSPHKDLWPNYIFFEINDTQTMKIENARLRYEWTDISLKVK